MDKKERIKLWLAEMRAPFLILAVLLVTIGLAFGWKYHPPGTTFNPLYAGLLLLGVVSSHISVNLFNEYSDNKTNIDHNTPRTPFSGGSGILSSGLLSSASVYKAALITLFIALAIGIYFAITVHWIIFILAGFGAFSILFYTPFLTKIQLGELFSGLTLGTFVVLGSYVVMTASPGMPITELFPKDVLLMSIPPGILTALLLLINEFPDMEADKQGGRKHLVIWLGRKKAAYVYISGMAATFGLIIGAALFNIVSPWFMLALIPILFAYKASMGALRHGHDPPKLIPALGMNVLTVLSTDLLIAIAVIMETF
ncbi:MAG: prenyltransferase [Bacteroidales bacterium]|nr:prenyltransferase [Bacteroidales bacterium]